MAAVERTISKKPIPADAGAIARALNDEVVPVALAVRAALNARPNSYAETFGDGTETTFSISHGLATSDVFVQVYDLDTGIEVVPSSIDRSSADEVVITYGIAPPATGHRVLVRS